MARTLSTPAASGLAVRPRAFNWRRLAKQALVYGTILFYLFVVLLPLYWMFKSSISVNAEMYGSGVKLIPSQVTFEHFVVGWNKWNFGLGLRNSLVVASITTALAVLMSCLGAYSLVRLRYPGRAALARSILFVYLIPGSLVFIPLFILMNQLRLVNTHLSLILSYLTFAIPFCTWMLIGYFKGIPTELEEAALIDGCTRLQSLYKVLIPLSAPGIVAAAIFSFSLSWNEFLYALIFVTTPSNKTLPPLISNLIRGDIYLWGPMMAGSVLAAAPVVILYIISQRFVVQGLGAGAVKG
jgi:multiple sugar transport system permease protein